MEFLMDYGLTTDDVKEIEKNNSKNVLDNIILNKENVRKVIRYLGELGVTKTTLKELFIRQIGMFFRTKEEIETVFEDYEMDSILKSLSYDVNTVDLIEF